MTFDLEDPKDTRKLAHPLALSKLTLFIMDIMLVRAFAAFADYFSRVKITGLSTSGFLCSSS